MNIKLIAIYIKVLLVLLLNLSTLNVNAQCTYTSIPGSCNLTFSTTPTGTYGNGATYYYCYSPGNSTPVNAGTITIGQSSYPGHLIVKSPADLTIATLNLDGSWGGLLYIENGAKVTITNGVTISGSAANLGIINYGTLIFNGAVSLSMGTIQTALTTSRTTFNSTFSLTVGNAYRSKGTTTSVGLVTINAIGNFAACLDNNSYWSAGAMTVSASSQIQTNTGNSIINYSGAISLASNTGYTANTVKFCNNGGSGSCANGTNVVCSATACSNPLPVVLTKFYANAEENGNNIIWQTAQEFNNSHFELEASRDGINFEKVAEIKGNGSTNTPTTYMHFDANNQVKYHPVYYRLKQVDFDGKFEYSNIIYLSNSHENASVTIFPNPLDEGTTLYATFGAQDAGFAKVNLYDLSGKLINSYSLEEIKPNGIYEIEDKNMLLPKGSYILEIITPQNVYNKVLDVK